MTGSGKIHRSCSVRLTAHIIFVAAFFASFVCFAQSDRSNQSGGSPSQGINDDTYKVDSNYSSGYRIDTHDGMQAVIKLPKNTYVNECQIVSSARPLFVPTKTPVEWDKFLIAATSTLKNIVTLAPCKGWSVCTYSGCDNSCVAGRNICTRTCYDKSCGEPGDTMTEDAGPCDLSACTPGCTVGPPANSHFNGTNYECNPGYIPASTCPIGQCDGTGCSAGQCSMVISSLPAYCGDCLVNRIEQCDTGASNGVPPPCGYQQSCPYCSSNCTNTSVLGRFCGDGNLDAGLEECDAGAQNGVACANDDFPCTYCSNDCKNVTIPPTHPCGPGQHWGGSQCCPMNYYSATGYECGEGAGQSTVCCPSGQVYGCGPYCDSGGEVYTCAACHIYSDPG